MELKEIESAIEGVLFAAGSRWGWSACVWRWTSTGSRRTPCANAWPMPTAMSGVASAWCRLDNSYQLCSAPEFADCIRRAFESRRPARLSQPALEVLAIIAYYQPATRAYVDQIRGVDSSLHRQPASGA